MLTGRNSVRGFTLVELMIGVVVMGILLALATPSFSLWMANTRVRNSAEAIQNGLQIARAEAVRRNRFVQFVLTNTVPSAANVNAVAEDANGTNWMVRVFDPAGNYAADDFIRGREGSEGSEDVTVGSTQATVTFTGLGRLNAAGMVQIDLMNAATDRPLRLVVDTAGLIRMCDPNVTNAGDPRIC
ncbi:MAG: GspH/FimT family pseudopilin [Burkholderiales bacterium]